jgi:hypothetical protein
MGMDNFKKDGKDAVKTHTADDACCEQTQVNSQETEGCSSSEAAASQHAWEEFCEHVQMEPESEENESHAQRQATMRYAEEQYQALMALQRELSSAYTTFMNISM